MTVTFGEAVTNCPNCGAPKRGAVCEYCGTHFGRYQGQCSVEVEPDIVTIYDWSGTVRNVINSCVTTVNINSEGA